MKIKAYIYLDEWVLLPGASIHTNNTDGSIDHISIECRVFDKILSDRDMEVDISDGLSIVNSPISNEMSEEEWENWDDSNPVSEIATNDGEYYWIDFDKCKIETT